MSRVQHNSFVHKAKVVFCNYILGSLLYNKLTLQNKNNYHLKRTLFVGHWNVMKLMCDNILKVNRIL